MDTGDRLQQMDDSETRDGWIIPPNQMVAHFFRAGLSLCGEVRYRPRQPEADGRYHEEYCCPECLRRRNQDWGQGILLDDGVGER